MIEKKILFTVITMALYSCSGSFSKGVKKDLLTGLSTSYNKYGQPNGSW